MSEQSNLRPIGVTLVAEQAGSGAFRLTQWRIARLTPGDQGSPTLWLQLAMAERAAYRFNLASGAPRLFVRAGFSGAPAEPAAITASQELAAAWMDGEQQVLEAPMPLAIQAWIEAYLARHGEAPELSRRQGRRRHATQSDDRSPR